MAEENRENKDNKDKRTENAAAGNFIHDIIDEELAPGGRCEGLRFTPAFLPNPTATFISATPRRSVSTSARR